MKRLVFLVIAAAISCGAGAQANCWKDRSGKPIAETEALKSKDDFAGMVIVTSDANWEEKWATPANVVPEFKEVRTLPKNEKAFVLIFFSNPKVSTEGRADVGCDIRITGPDGSIPMDQRDTVCYQGAFKGASTNLYLSAPVIGFVGEAADPAGKWTVSVTLKDRLRGTELSLNTSFMLQ